MVLYSHAMACLIHPGNIKKLESDIKLLKQKGLYNKINTNKDLLSRHFKGAKPSLEMRHLMKFRFQPLPDLKYETSPLICLGCEDVKLIRSHHCRI